jgi:hypothetical protein
MDMSPWWVTLVHLLTQRNCAEAGAEIHLSPCLQSGDGQFQLLEIVGHLDLHSLRPLGNCMGYCQCYPRVQQPSGTYCKLTTLRPGCAAQLTLI